MEEWGAICSGAERTELLVADVVCRQLGFPHGTTVSPSSNAGAFDYSEEAEESQERFWLTEAQCRGPEERLVDCNLGQGFIADNAGCRGQTSRLTVACRTFAITEALEEVVTPGAGVPYAHNVS